MKLFLLFFIVLTSLSAQEELSSLLNTYKHESELSKITKKEEAGVIDIYTRHDLEVMQAKTLEDVLRILPGFHLTRSSNNLTSLQKPSISSVQLSSIRLYINDHDMSSTSFGSAALIWGELPIEYIDHIEIYKGASSIEFGNEVGSIIMKLYTKTAAHEEGGKVRLYGDDYGSTNLDTYVASAKNDFSYFTYANINNINRKEYENSYEGTNYPLKSDHSGHNIYANLQYKKWILELGSYYKKSDNLLGIGVHHTPSDGNLDAYHNYLHLTKKFQSNIKLQISYDKLSYEQNFIDPNGIAITNAPIVNTYDTRFEDQIFSLTLEKKIIYEKHSLLLGSFYKRKEFTEYGNFNNDSGTYLNSDSFSNALDLYSAYSEYIYNYDSTTRLIASLKGDFFHYDKSIPSKNELSTKLGLIKKIDKFQAKAFLTTTYIPTAFYQLYNPTNVPYKTNPDLDNMHLTIGTLTFKYTQDKNKFKVVIAENKLSNIIVYNPALANGYYNSSKTSNYLRLDFKYSYIFDLNNKFTFDVFNGKNDSGISNSPKYGSIIQLFSKYKKFDIYNELTYKTSYDYLGLSMDAALNYVASVKYHYTKDLSLGLRGENIFNSGYKQAYKDLDYAIPVTDQKIWFNLEYLF